jgi:hypothetical protein
MTHSKISTPALVVDLLEGDDDAELVAFLDALGAAPNGAMVLGYHYPENRDMLLQILQPDAQACYFAARSPTTGELLAVLPGFVKHAGGLACYNSLPFFGPNVGVLADASDSASYAGIADALYKSAIDYANGQGAATATFYSAFNPEEWALPSPCLDGQTSVIRVRRATQFLRIPDGGSIQWPSAARRNIAKAIGAGIVVSDDVRVDDLNAIFEIYTGNCLDNGIPLKPRECLAYLIREAAQRTRIRAYRATLNDTIVAALFVFWGPSTVSYYIPCSQRAYRHLQPGALLVDHAIRDAAKSGMRYWNWESSPGPDSGVYAYKKKWGSIDSSFETVVVRLRGSDDLEVMEAGEITRMFPYFYVFPFSHLCKRSVQPS